MSLFQTINCTNSSCSTISETYINSTSILVGILLIISFIGIVFNSISVYIFFISKSMKTRFFQYLKIFSIHSLLTNLNDFLFYILFIALNQTIYMSGDALLYTSETFIRYHTYFYLLAWSYIYTFGGIISIFIVYERLQMYNPGLKFMSKLSPLVISIIVIMVSILINLPVNISRIPKENSK